MEYTSLNEECCDTILLVPGAGPTPNTWKPLYPYLATYHILVPHLPRVCNLERDAGGLAQLVTSRAHNGVAHVIGFSLGTHITLKLAQLHPDILQNRKIVLSGFNKLKKGVATNTLYPYLWTGIERVGRLLPQSQGSEEPTSPAIDVSVAKSTMSILSSWDDASNGLPALAVPILVIAATKGHFGLPTGDSIASAKELLRAISIQGNNKSRAVKAEEGRHAWPLEQPEAFASCVKTWIEYGDVDEGFLTPL